MAWTCLQCGTDWNLDPWDDCRKCGTAKGTVKDQQQMDDWEKSNPELAKVAKEKQKTREAFNSIIISTGDLKESYQILDAVFALDYHTGGFGSSADPSKAFDGVKTKLRQISKEMGGDAVINCQFEYRVALVTTAGGVVASLLGPVIGEKISDKSQAIEIFAYGTAVKLTKAERQA